VRARACALAPSAAVAVAVAVALGWRLCSGVSLSAHGYWIAQVARASRRARCSACNALCNARWTHAA